MKKIPCMLFRAGTSKGPFFLKSDLPNDPAIRDRALLSIMGSPDIRQIDGIGGGDYLSSKVALVSVSTRDDADINYLFCQVHVEEAIVETNLNCGNMLSAVAPFAIEKGLIQAKHPETVVRIYNENTGVIVHACVKTPQGKVQYQGETHIDGVPGTAAAIKLSFLNAVGAKTGKLLPTGQLVDNIDGVAVSCVDVAVPMVIIDAKALHESGYESKLELDNDERFKNQLENIRKKAALKMGLGDVSSLISPKVSVISPARYGGTITSHYFTPFTCHAAHAVTGGLCLAAACLIPGTLANKIAKLQTSTVQQYEQEITIEHVSGTITTSIEVNKKADSIAFPKASFIRTYRLLFAGDVFYY